MENYEYEDQPLSADFKERLNAHSEDEDQNTANALRAGLDDYELDEEDIDILEQMSISRRQWP